jgi:hypothetical protein
LQAAMSFFYRVLITGLGTAQRAAGNTRLRLHIRRAKLSLERQRDAEEAAA